MCMIQGKINSVHTFINFSHNCILIYGLLNDTVDLSS
jgi:hypothetical protein